MIIKLKITDSENNRMIKNFIGLDKEFEFIFKDEKGNEQTRRMKMKLVMYAHGGSKNHGCTGRRGARTEAIEMFFHE